MNAIQKLNDAVKAQAALAEQCTTTNSDGTKNFMGAATEAQVTEFRNRQKEIDEKLGPAADLEREGENAIKRAQGVGNGEGAGDEEGKKKPVKARMDDPSTVTDDELAMKTSRYEMSDAFKASSDAVKSMFFEGDPIGAFNRCLRDQIKTYNDAVKSKNPSRFEFEPNTSIAFVIPEEIVTAVKTVMYTSSASFGWAPHVPRIDKVVEYATRRPMLDSIIPSFPATAPSFQYMEETVEENNAAPVAENAQKPYSQFLLEPQTVTIEVIAHLFAMTEQQVADIPQFMSFMQQRGLLMLDLKTEDQLLSGNGSTPNLQGFLTKSGINTQSQGSDTIPDAIYKLFTKVRTVGFAEPSHVVINPSDWEGVRLMKTADGLYIWGHPAEAGPERLWGKPIMQTTAITAKTVLTGDFPLFSGLYGIGGVQIAVTNSHSDDFEYNRLRARIEHRKGLAIFRAAAFGKATLV